MEKRHILSKHGMRVKFHIVSDSLNEQETSEQCKEKHNIGDNFNIHDPTYLTERIEISDPDEFV